MVLNLLKSKDVKEEQLKNKLFISSIFSVLKFNNFIEDKDEHS